MTVVTPIHPADPRAPNGREPVRNLSRRGVLGIASGALLLGVGLRLDPAAAQTRAEGPAAVAPKPGTRVAAFLEIRPDSSVHLLSPFVEGGQGINTGLAQTIGEELDLDPARFVVDCAPPGPDYAVVNGLRMTGGSFSTRSSFEAMRRLGATAREMLLRAAAAKLAVPQASLTTEDGRVLHRASGRALAYGELAAAALALPPRDDVPLKDPKDFRWIGQPVARLDMRDKSTGRATYAIDLKVDGMLHAAVVHAPHLGTEPEAIANEAAVRAMPGIHSVHRLPGAVAVTADSWWRARKAVEALQVSWTKPAAEGLASVSAAFSSVAMLGALRSTTQPGIPAEQEGDPAAAFKGAAKIVEAAYDAPYLAHAQLEPPSAIAHFQTDGSLDLWLPNQMPELFQQISAKVAGLQPDSVRIHSPMLGGFFGRHFYYGPANPFPQAILLAKATKRPVRVLWSREEEFGMDAVRPLGFARFRAALGPDGMPVGLQTAAVGEGPIGRWFGSIFKSPVDSSVVEGLDKKPYAIPNRRLDYVKVAQPVTIAFWRSVGHSMNDFFYESFLDEIAEAGGQDPFALRMALLKDSPRHRTLLQRVADLAGGWKRGPFEAEDGTRRARGVSMASPFGSETATIAEVSLKDGEARVHDLWIAIDPGQVVNPAIVKRQVEGAAALGLSATLLEQVVYEGGQRQARNYDAYPILDRERMPRVQVAIVESGAPMGGIGEPGLPGVPPAVVNAVAALTGQRVRSLPLSKARLSGA
ncbi:xanthine dehydrogenase family protein molybdopterin-binding subunit [Methylobacterium planeticum]|uniref:Xanthine dehydrogenase family protein molybdopterin-binding subunit n=1 Tax=Methylobacterium planeticum TaxID=2615211 RepID=A0A6N6MFH8_9HYPH|nr:xanthine dehydrogenase family protein molybdopterin-binding subunit [Methylobacterium planeticum]KAB1069564.1 xanthine dehydrogenase family protein molybdopterin-binding subunit [Methylobacterium planeticum]